MIHPVVIGFLVAALVGVVGYQLVPIPASYWRKEVSKSLMTREEAEMQLPLWRALILPFNFLAKYAPATQLRKTRTDLYWAQRAGEWRGWDEVSFWGLRLACAVVGLFLSISRGPTYMAAAVGLGFMLPQMLLNSKARKARKTFLRELPEVVQLLALAVGTGKSIREALRVVGQGRGLVSRWIQEVLVQSAGRELFTARGSRQPGFLRQRAIETGMPALVALAVQLDLIHARGTGAKELLGDLAVTVASEYEAEMMEKAERVGSELILPIILFFFIPYLVAIVAPMAVQLMNLLES